MSKPIYKLVDSKGRVLIPKALRETAHMEYGDIVRIGLSSGRITVTKDVYKRQPYRRGKGSCKERAPGADRRDRDLQAAQRKMRGKTP